MPALLDEIFYPPPSSKNTPVSKPTFKRVTKKSLFDVDVVPAENTGKGVFFLQENECISKSGKYEESDFADKNL